MESRAVRNEMKQGQIVQGLKKDFGLHPRTKGEPWNSLGQEHGMIRFSSETSLSAVWRKP